MWLLNGLPQSHIFHYCTFDELYKDPTKTGYLLHISFFQCSSFDLFTVSLPTGCAHIHHPLFHNLLHHTASLTMTTFGDKFMVIINT
ncbi:hypothetical protein NECAME_13572 [Necator americanus]|uniref:Uncharacterized protein n=1 Tax=Necator americanus TaxID=51031 RepID=W2SU38_NECAM|nr:hypothetical protein NECAME_13572 [Necator americanus]ETN73249.1 hypothetical protein NECAME_13572 [Necator americanus]